MPKRDSEVVEINNETIEAVIIAQSSMFRRKLHTNKWKQCIKGRNFHMTSEFLAACVWCRSPGLTSPRVRTLDGDAGAARQRGRSVRRESSATGQQTVAWSLTSLLAQINGTGLRRSYFYMVYYLLPRSLRGPASIYILQLHSYYCCQYNLYTRNTRK